MFKALGLCTRGHDVQYTAIFLVKAAYMSTVVLKSKYLIQITVVCTILHALLHNGNIVDKPKVC